MATKKAGRPRTSVLKTLSVQVHPEGFAGLAQGQARYGLGRAEFVRTLLGGLAKNDKKIQDLYDSLLCHLRESVE